MKECIKPEEMCCITLRHLASGESFRSVECQFRINKKAISYIVQEVCSAIIEALGKDNFETSETTEEWMEIAEKFYRRWNFPNGLGGVDRTESWHSLSLNKASNATHEAKAIREEFSAYFNNERCIPWQWHCVRLDV